MLWMQDFLVGNSVMRMNEEAISNILVDVDFIEQSLRDSGQAHLSSIFDHLKLVGRLLHQFAFYSQVRIAGVYTIE
jgi:hypothetical protein